MLKHSRRSFLLALPALPLAAKAFVRPSRAAVAEFQKIYLTQAIPHLIQPSPYPIQTAPVFDGLTGGTFKLEYDGQTTGDLPWDAAPEQIQAAFESVTAIDRTGHEYFPFINNVRVG